MFARRVKKTTMLVKRMWNSKPLWFCGALGMYIYTSDQCAPGRDMTVRFSRSMWAGLMVTVDYKVSLFNVKPDSPEEAEIFKQVHKRAAQRVLAVCKKNSGLYIKAGQYLASLNNLLPEEYTSTLSVLQDKAPHQPIDMVRRVIKKDFYKDIEDLFQYFDEEPLAAASLAQVHRATTKMGEDVAVKVQYEQLQGQFDGDIMTHHALLYCLKTFFPGFDFTFAGTEMEEALSKELDFMHEANNSERAAAKLTVKNVYIPKVYHKLTSKRVLTCEFIDGCKITDVERIKEMGFSIKDVTKSMLEAFSEQIFVSGFVHADPHPGNVFVRKNPLSPKNYQVVILDHGLYRELDEELRITWCHLWKAMIEKDNSKIEYYGEQMGVSKDKADLLPGMILMRAHNDSTRVGLGAGMTDKEMKEIAENAKKRMGEFVEILRVLPPAIWLILRNNNLLRSVNQELGVPVNRFLIMGRYAVNGLHSKDSIIPPGKEMIYYTYWFLHAKYYVKRFTSRLIFEGRLASFLFSYWLFDRFISLLILFGKVKEVEIEELIKAA